MKPVRIISRSALGITVFGVIAASCTLVAACSIPVFRYALERWPASPYEVVVLHRGALSDADQKLVDQMRKAAEDETQPANLMVVTVDLDKMAEAAKAARREPADGVDADQPSADSASPGPGKPAADVTETAIDHSEEEANESLAADAAEVATAQADTVATDTSGVEAPPADPAAELLKKYADLKSPQLLVHFPPYGPQRWQAWSGPLNAQNVQRLIDSPLRQEIAKRILAGDSAVWVLVDSGDEKKDAEAEALLRRELKRMEKVLELPPQELLEAEQEFQPDTQVELRIGFSLIRLHRDDPREHFFLAALLQSEPDLAEFKEPITIPIFGRGRTFFALVGKGINTENIEDNCYFICGDCSCQIKEQNPGMDMLMAVNWDEHLMGSAFPDVALPELTGIGGLEVIDVDPLSKSDPPAEAAVAESDPGASEPEAAAESSDAVAGEPAPAASQAATTVPGENPSATVAETDSLVPTGTTATAEGADSFGLKLLLWTLAAAALAAVVIVSSSFWMRSRQQV